MGCSLFLLCTAGSKITAVVAALQRLAAVDPEAKSIVFSQWDAMLALVHRGLDRNHICAVRLGGYRTGKLTTALHRFQSDPTAKVLLLPTARAGKGLNITEATHVFLVDTMLTPAVELQAMGRVHRIGQTKPTFVYR